MWAPSRADLHSPDGAHRVHLRRAVRPRPDTAPVRHNPTALLFPCLPGAVVSTAADELVSRERVGFTSRLASVQAPGDRGAPGTLQLMGVAQDHLVAMAAVIRAPFTVMALLTLLRTQIVATARAWYVTDPHIDIRERYGGRTICSFSR